MSISRVKTLMAAAVLAGVSALGFGSAAHAVTCSPDAGKDRYVTFDGGTSCLDYGTGAQADNLFQADNPTYVQIAKAEAATPNALDGILDATTGGLFTGTSGNITWTPPAGYSAFAVLFKFGQPSIEDSWFVFTLPTTGFVSSYWFLHAEGSSTPLSQYALSHTTLYGVPAPVPVPAAGVLLIGALGGLAMVRRRRKA